RLRAMVGANALLGEALRVGLPKLARETGRGWAPAPSSEAYPSADLDDPLKDHDEPSADAKNGILSRDGGHVEGAGGRRLSRAHSRRRKRRRQECGREPQRAGGVLPSQPSALAARGAEGRQRALP